MSSSSAASSSDSEPSMVPVRAAQTEPGKSSMSKVSKPRAAEDNIKEDSSLSSGEYEDSASLDEDEDASEQEEDEPVLSHAERRRQKKKQQREVPSTSDDPSKEKQPKSVKNTADLAPSKLPKRQNSIWVGNLSFKTTADALKQFFEGCGEVTRIHMPMKMASGGKGMKGAVKENRGFAYVDFATPDQKTVAVAMSENHLDGRRLLIKDGSDFNGRPSTSTAADTEEGTSDKKSNPVTATKTAQKILRAQKQPPGPTLFFGNLGFATTEESLRDMLTRNQKRGSKAVAKDDGDDEEPAEPQKNEKWIRKIRLGTFEDSGKCKGWAFVDFFKNDDATEALVNIRNHHLDGRQLVVEYASPDAVRRGGGPRGDDTSKDKRKGKDKDTSGEHGSHKHLSKRKVVSEDVDNEGDAEMGDEAQETQERPATKKRRTDGNADAPRTHRYAKEGKPPKARPKPGAALALAKRETATIVPSQGKKIVF